MVKVKVEEAFGIVLDYMVARCDQPDWTEEDARLWIQDDEYKYHPSTNWSQGGRSLNGRKLKSCQCLTLKGGPQGLQSVANGLTAPHHSSQPCAATSHPASVPRSTFQTNLFNP